MGSLSFTFANGPSLDRPAVLRLPATAATKPRSWAQLPLRGRAPLFDQGGVGLNREPEAKRIGSTPPPRASTDNLYHWAYYRNEDGVILPLQCTTAIPRSLQHLYYSAS